MLSPRWLKDNEYIIGLNEIVEHGLDNFPAIIAIQAYCHCIKFEFDHFDLVSLNGIYKKVS